MRKALLFPLGLMAAMAAGCDESNRNTPTEPVKSTPIDGIYQTSLVPEDDPEGSPREALFDLLWRGDGFDLYYAGPDLPWPDVITDITLEGDNAFSWEDETGDCWIRGEARTEEVILTGNCLARENANQADITIRATARPLTDSLAIDGYYDLAMSDIDYAKTLMPKNWNATVSVSVNTDGLLDISAFGFFYAEGITVTNPEDITWEG